jgi:tRNA pseudouridine13 synthase
LPIAQAHIKRSPEDWRVIEHLPEERLRAIEAGNGEHLYLCVRKRSLNTLEVARRLADAFALPLVAVGFAGRKDKHAVTDQWFSVHTAQAPDHLRLDGEQLEVLAAGRYAKKLRHGEHRANEFRIRLRDVDGIDGIEGLGEKLKAPFPNVFGEQRFGANNVDEATTWVLERRSRRVSRQQQGWYLSVLRSHLFNQVVEHRQRHADITTVLEGDCLVDGVATAPLWGRGRSQTRGRALELEREALSAYGDVCEALEYAGVRQERRKVHCAPARLSVAVCGTAVDLCCELPPGAYATAMLGNCFQLVDDAR